MQSQLPVGSSQMDNLALDWIISSQLPKTHSILAVILLAFPGWG